MALSQLYFITMEDAPIAVAEQVRMACQAGIRLIQLRMKEAGNEEFLRTAVAVKSLCDGYGATLIINDRVEIAQAIDAGGVHVGKEDISVREARRILGADKIVGGTANTLKDARDHWLAGADYIGLGPFRFTATKKNLSPILGMEGCRLVMESLVKSGIPVPVFAIGGIGAADVGALLDAGMYGVAFSGMLVHAGDVEERVKELESVLLNRKIVDYADNSG